MSGQWHFFASSPPKAYHWTIRSQFPEDPAHKKRPCNAIRHQRSAFRHGRPATAPLTPLPVSGRDRASQEAAFPPQHSGMVFARLFL